MRYIKKLFAVVLIFAFAPGLLFPQYQELSTERSIKFKPGIGFEYLNRTLDWGDDNTSKLNSYLFTLNAEIEIQDRISLSAIAGYSLSSFDKLLFKQLPFSIELDTGNIGGYLFGSELNFKIYNFNDFEIKARGQFIYYIATKKEWAIPGLSVSGNVTGKPNWWRIIAGPQITYTGFDYFYPYIFISYSDLRGTYSMEQSIEDLSGKEDKKIVSLGNICAAIGTYYELTDYLNIKAEILIIPNETSLDFSFILGTLFSF